MISLIVNTIAGATVISLLPNILPGIKVKSFRAAVKLLVIIVCLKTAISFLFGWFLGIIHFVTLFLSYFILNALIFDFASDLVADVEVDSFKSALAGSLVLTILWSILTKVAEFFL